MVGKNSSSTIRNTLIYFDKDNVVFCIPSFGRK